MSLHRRTVLKAIATGSALVGASVLMPKLVFAAWNKSAFGADEQRAAIKALYGTETIGNSSEVTLKAPDIAENGAVVPVTLSTTLAQVETISLFIENNPFPLAAEFIIPEGTEAKVATRVRMGKTSKVTVVVKAGGKLYSASKEVKVTIGGCGG